jgi:hypothetical protein
MLAKGVGGFCGWCSSGTEIQRHFRFSHAEYFDTWQVRINERTPCYGGGARPRSRVLPESTRVALLGGKVTRSPAICRPNTRYTLALPIPSLLAISEGLTPSDFNLAISSACRRAVGTRPL